MALVQEMEPVAIEGDSTRAERARQALGERARRAGRAPPALLSDRLSLKHFSLIDAELRMVADAANPPLRYRVRHETVYSYGGNVAHSHQLLHLTPREAPGQTCHRTPSRCRRRRVRAATTSTPSATR